MDAMTKFPLEIAFVINIIIILTVIQFWSIMYYYYKHTFTNIDNSLMNLLIPIAIVINYSVVLSITFSGSLKISSFQLVPYFVIFLFIETSFLFLLLFNLKFRNLINRIPLYLLIGIQWIRIIGLVFPALSSKGIISSNWAIPVGLGDLISGLLAILASIMIYKKWRYAIVIASLWNIIGLLDGINALLLTYHYNSDSIMATQYPILGIFIFVVPILIFSHIISIYKIIELRLQHQSVVSGSNEKIIFNNNR